MAGIFGRKRYNPLGGFDPSVFMTPGYGDGVGQSDTVMDMSVPQDPYAGQRPQGGGGIFGKGGFGGFMGDVLAYGPMAFAARAGRQREDEQIQREFDQKMQLEQMRARQQQEGQFDTFGSAETGYFGRDGFGNISELMKGTGPKPTTMQQNFEWFNGLSPEQQKIARRLLPNYGLTEEGIVASGRRAAATRAPARPRAGAAPKLPAGFILD